MYVDGVLVFVPIRERAEPIDVFVREERARRQHHDFIFARQLVFAGDVAARVRTKGREATVARRQHELVPALLDDLEPRVLVVATKGDHARGNLFWKVTHELDDFARARPAIDVVAEKNDRVLFVERGQTAKELEEMRRVSVDVPDRECPIRHASTIHREWQAAHGGRALRVGARSRNYSEALSVNFASGRGACNAMASREGMLPSGQSLFGA